MTGRKSRSSYSRMDQRRQLLPAIVAVSLFFIWLQIAPLLFPQFFKAPVPPGAQQAALNAQAQAQADEQAANAPPVDNANDDSKPAEFPPRTIVLGEPGFENGYLLKVDIVTKGAAIDAVWLTDPRYTTLDRKEQLRIVGNDIAKNVGIGNDPETFDLQVAAIDSILARHKLSLDTVNWEVVAHNENSATLRYPSPAGDFEVIKTFNIEKVDLATRDTSTKGYMVDLKIELRNLSDAPVKTTYALTGPVGVPLENVENSRLFREVKVGTLENPRRPQSITPVTLLATELVKQHNASLVQGGRPVESWHLPIAYAGVDDQFFAALVLPQGNQFEDKNGDNQPDATIAVTRPLLLHLNAARPERSDMTVVMESPTLTVEPHKEVTASFSAFFGPKRPDLIRELNAESIIQLGWFSFVSKFMLWILGLFHSLGVSYAFSIILLTVTVRLAMFPLSRKQAIEAEKMKILAPKMKEMQDRYKGQPEEFAKAYREFQRRYNYHPMVGCLPALVQLPIFLGLYNALFHAADLRLSRFLWIDNLAAPDNLFPLGFTVPWFGWTQFNLLPILTVALFVVQQKLFTPPPTSDEQAMQYRIMNVMMIAIGFAFYTVPAGLCVYFISSSLWGIIERLLLKKSLATHQQAVAEAGADVTPDGTVITVPKQVNNKSDSKAEPKKPTWWQQALAAADEAKKNSDPSNTPRKFSKDKAKGKDKGKGKK